MALVGRAVTFPVRGRLISGHVPDEGQSLSPADGRKEDAIAHLAECVTWGLRFADYDPDAPHASLAFRGEIDGGYVGSAPDESFRAELAKWLNEDDFTPLRDREDLAALIGRITK